MAIAQCRQWIKTHMAGIRVSEVPSTALAAKVASSDPTASAIGSRLAGRTYGLNILEQNIEDSSDNFTRFLVIGKQNTKPSGRDKTSFLFRPKPGPDPLYKVLGVLARHGINLVRIESRPTKERKWEYIFFIDVEGHKKEHRVAKAFSEMQIHCLFLKWLGSYQCDPDH